MVGGQEAAPCQEGGAVWEAMTISDWRAAKNVMVFYHPRDLQGPGRSPTASRFRDIMQHYHDTVAFCRMYHRGPALSLRVFATCVEGNFVSFDRDRSFTGLRGVAAIPAQQTAEPSSPSSPSPGFYGPGGHLLVNTLKIPVSRNEDVRMYPQFQTGEIQLIAGGPILLR